MGKRLGQCFRTADQGVRIILSLSNDTGTPKALGIEGDNHPLETPWAQVRFLGDGQNKENFKEDDIQHYVWPLFEAFCALVDPSDNQKYLPWICRVYLDRAEHGDPIKSEDLYKIGEELAYFDGAKRHIQAAGLSPDIQDYQSYDAFTAAIRPLMSARDMKRMKSGLTDEIRAETSILYEGPLGRIVVPHTLAASQFWGATTHWCISGDKDGPIYFPKYYSLGPLVMYIPRTKDLTLPTGLISGKVAAAFGEIRDEMDKLIWPLPPQAQALYDGAMVEAAANKREGLQKYLERFGHPPEPEALKQKDNQTRPIPEDIPEKWDAALRLVRYNSHINAFKKNRLLFENPDFILLAVQQKAEALSYAPTRLHNDKAFLLEAVRKNGDVLKFIESVLRHDRDVVIAAIENTPFALAYAGEELQNDKEVVLRAVLKDGMAFRYASKNLRGDRDVMMAALSNNGLVLSQCGFEAQNDREFVMVAVSNNGLAIECAGPGLLNDHEIGMVAVKNDKNQDSKNLFASHHSVLQHLSKALQKDRDIVIASVKANGLSLKYAHTDLRDDREIALIAIYQDARAFNYASHSLKYEDDEFLIDAISHNPDVLRYLNERHADLWNDPDFARALLEIYAVSGEADQKKMMKHFHRLKPLWGMLGRSADEMEAHVMAQIERAFFAGCVHEQSQAPANAGQQERALG